MSSASPSFIHSDLFVLPLPRQPWEARGEGGQNPLPSHQAPSACLWFWRVLKDKQILTILASKINKDTWSLSLECDFGRNFGLIGWKNQFNKWGHWPSPATRFPNSDPGSWTQQAPHPVSSISLIVTHSLTSQPSNLLPDSLTVSLVLSTLTSLQI